MGGAVLMMSSGARSLWIQYKEVKHHPPVQSEESLRSLFSFFKKKKQQHIVHQLSQTSRAKLQPATRGQADFSTLTAVALAGDSSTIPPEDSPWWMPHFLQLSTGSGRTQAGSPAVSPAPIGSSARHSEKPLPEELITRLDGGR